MSIRHMLKDRFANPPRIRIGSGWKSSVSPNRPSSPLPPLPFINLDLKLSHGVSYGCASEIQIDSCVQQWFLLLRCTRVHAVFHMRGARRFVSLKDVSSRSSVVLVGWVVVICVFWSHFWEDLVGVVRDFLVFSSSSIWCSSGICWSIGMQTRREYVDSILSFATFQRYPAHSNLNLDSVWCI